MLALHQLPASDPPPQNESGSECVNLGEGAGLLCGGDWYSDSGTQPEVGQAAEASPLCDISLKLVRGLLGIKS